VRDIATPESEAEAADVSAVLSDLGAGEAHGQHLLEVWNKIDLLPADARAALLERAAYDRGAVAISAVTGEGCGRLVERLALLVDEGPILTIDLDGADGEGLAWVYRHGRVLERRDDEDGVTLRARLDPAALGQFERMRPQAVAALAAD
jgi:GTP-binding protein HflX